MIWLAILSLVLAGGLIVYCCEQKRVNKDIGSLRQHRDELIKQCHRLSDENDSYADKHIELEEKCSNLQMECDSWEHKKVEARDTYRALVDENTKQQTDIIKYTERLQGIQNAIQLQQARLDIDIKELRATKMEQLQQELDKAQKDNAAAIFTAQQNTQSQIDQYQKQAEAARTKYFSIINVLKENENDDETHRLHISEQARNDIEYLLNAVALRLNNPNIIYKLIWSEYIQGPANELLNHILPDKDCSGIYKITNCEDKRCYIGRSTSVRKRLQEHIKSSIGIENIASQRVHEVMREKGLWNFRFELLEECPKDQLGEREKYYIEFFDSQSYGYNQVSGSAYKDKGDN